ncbi:MAG: hypothetical protein DMG32_06280 [Acidobacteria bacterium]|nr:MAG: hypothetical protein DMG32_06280 [Acidobacteriota bacterium]
MLEASNKQNEITNWLMWFAGVAVEAQRRTITMAEFLIDKTKLRDRLKGQLNEQQEKALQRRFREGPEGFRGGLTAGKYSTITGASPATTTRDLADLVAIPTRVIGNCFCTWPGRWPIRNPLRA